MSKEIDERVVEMKFDNRNFEKNVQVSLNTLDRLKKKSDLSKAGKGLENLGKAADKVSFDKMSKSIDTVKVKLSAMSVVGATVLSNITNSVINSARKMENVVKDAVIGGGVRRAQNIENAHFQLQGLLKDEEKVQAVMDDAMYSVDGTAYAYDEAAKAASQFAASGLEAGEDMRKALRAITGVAAMTNSEYESISQIFTTVAGNGRLMGDQLLQLSSRGMNAAATLATYLGKSEQEVRDMVSAGEISFQMFSDAMDDAFGEHAKKANETFTGAMSNVKAALARIGAKFVSPLIVQNGALVQFFNTLRQRVNDINSHIDPMANAFTATVTRIVELLNRAADNSLAFNIALTGVGNIAKSVGKIIKALGKAFYEMTDFKGQTEIVHIAENFTKMTKAMIISDTKAEKLKRSFKGVIAVFDIFNYTITSGIKFALKTFNNLLGLNNDSLLDATANLGDMLVHFRDWLKDGDKVTEFLTGMTSKINEFTSSIKSYFTVVKGGGGGGPKTTSTLVKIGQVIYKVFNAVQGYFKGGIAEIKAFIERVKDLDGISLDNLGEVFSDFAENVLGYFIDIEGAFDLFKNGISALAGFAKSHLGNAENAITGFGSRIVNFFKKFNKKIKVPELDLGAIMAAGFAIGIIKVLKKLDDTLNKIYAPIDMMKKIVESLTGVLKTLQTKIKSEAILNIAIAIGVLAGSVVALALVPSDKLWSAVGAITVLSAVLAGLSLAMSKVDKIGNVKSMGGVGVVFLEFAAALLLMTKAIEKISKVEDFGKGLLRITELGIELSGFMIGLSFALAKATPQLTGIGLMIVGFAAGLKILVSALDDLITVVGDSGTAKITAALNGMLKMILGLAAVAFASKGVKLTSGLGILAIAASLKVLVMAFDEIADFDMDKAKSNIGAFLLLFGSLIGLMALSRKAGSNIAQAGLGILAMSAGLLLLAQSFKMISKFDSKQLTKSILAIGGIFIAFGIAIKASKSASKDAAKAGLMLMELSGAMLLLTASIAVLGYMDSEKLKQGLIAVGILEALFAGLIFVTKYASASKELQRVLLQMTITIGVMAAAIGLLSMVDQKDLQSATLCLSGMMGVFVIFEGVTLALSKFGGNFGQTMKTLGVMTGVVGMLAFIIWQLSKLPVENVKGVTRGLSELLLSLSASAAILAVIGNFGSGILAGTVALMGMATLLTGFFTILGGVFRTMDELVGPEMEESLKKGIKILSMVGQGLGEFAGSIVKGFAETAMSSMPNIGKSLSEFMTNAQPFFDGLDKIKPESTNAIKDLAVALGLLMAEDFVGKLSKFTGLGGNDFNMSGFRALGDGLSEFANATSGLDDGAIENIKKSAEAAKAVAEVAKELPNSGGIAGFFAGENDMDTIGPQMEAFGKGIKAYGDAVDGVNSQAIENSIEPAKAIMEVAKVIPNDGGLVGGIVGNNDMATFGDQMASFGKSLVTYSLAVWNLKADAIQNSIPAAKAMVEVAEQIPNSSGLASLFTGDNTMGLFGFQMQVFGKSLVSYGKTVAKADTDSITKSAGAARAMVNVANAIAPTTGLVDLFKGNKTLSLFGSQMVEFGKSLKKYGKEVGKIDTESIRASAEAVKHLQGVLSNMANIDASSVKDFSKSLKKISTSTLTNFLKDFSKSVPKYSKCGEDLVDNIVKGVDSKKSTITDSIVVGVGNAASSIRNYYSQFYSAGSYLVDGFANAIKNNVSKAVNAASQMGSASENALKKSLDEHSPSKKTELAGAFFVQGYVNALGAGKDKVKKVSSELGTVSMKGLFEAMNTKTLADGLPQLLANSISNSIKSVSKSMAYGNTVLQKFYDSFLQGGKKLQYLNTALNASAKAISAYGKQLYKESSYYEQDNKNLKEHKKELADLKKKRNSLQKDLKKSQNGTLKNSKKTTKQIQNDIKTVNKSIKEANKQIKQDQKDIAEHTKQVFNDLRDSLAESVKSFIDPFTQSLENGIDLFSKFETSDSLYAQDEKNLKQYESDLESLTKQREELQNEITRLEKINTLETRNQGKRLENTLEEVEKKIEETTKNIEDVQQSMAEHSQITVQSILENMQSQVDGVTDWNNKLNALAGRGVATGLLEKLKEMGPESADYVNQFMKMTNDEITKANELFAKSTNMTSQTLLDNFQASLDKASAWANGMTELANRGFSQDILEHLGNMGPDAYEYMNALLTMTPEQQAQFQQKYASYLSLPESTADTVMASYVKAGADAVEGFTAALDALNGKMLTLSESLSLKALDGGLTFGEALSSGISKKKTKVKDSAKNTAKSGRKAAASEMSSGKGQSIGKNFDEGIAKGISDNTSKITYAAKQVASSIPTSVRKILGIKSPSRVAAVIGKYFDLGLIKGFNGDADEVRKTAVKNMTDVVSAVADSIDTDTSIQPKIRPVIDYSEIQNGRNTINGMMGNLQGSVKINSQLANDIRDVNNNQSDTWAAINNLGEAVKQLKDSQGVTITNEFNIDGAQDPRAVAQEVSAIIQRQVDRRTREWA